MILFAWLCACARPTWTAEGALSPILAELDVDGDGRVGAEESRLGARAFDGADGDHDGALSAVELETSLRVNDPDRWLEHVIRPSPELADMMRREHLADRSDGWRLQVLAEEVRARDPAADVPSTEELLEAARAGRESDAWRVAVGRIDAAWTKAGRTLPASLRR